MEKISLKSKLIAIQNELKVPKSNKNDFGGYTYRNIEDILEEVKKIAQKLNCCIVMTEDLKEKANRVYIKSTVMLFDGDSDDILQSVAYAQEPQNQKSMSDPQKTGSAISYARKYACQGLFGISDSSLDPDKTNTHGKAVHKSTISEPTTENIVTEDLL